MGTMAIVGRNFALLESHRLRLSGYFTWLIWGIVHLTSLPQMQRFLEPPSSMNLAGRLLQ